MKWTEVFSDVTRRVIGTRTIPLSYVIREIVDVPSAAPALSRLSGSTATSLRQEPFSDDFGSVEEELIGRATHSHPLYRDDNATIYFFLEEATRSTMYASSIQPHSRRKDGRGAWLALTNQYAGKDKWPEEIFDLSISNARGAIRDKEKSSLKTKYINLVHSITILKK